MTIVRFEQPPSSWTCKGVLAGEDLGTIAIRIHETLEVQSTIFQLVWTRWPESVLSDHETERSSSWTSVGAFSTLTTHTCTHTGGFSYPSAPRTWANPTSTLSGALRPSRWSVAMECDELLRSNGLSDDGQPEATVEAVRGSGGSGRWVR